VQVPVDPVGEQLDNPAHEEPGDDHRIEPQRQASQARAGLRAGWMAVTEDRRKARIVAIEVVGVSSATPGVRAWRAQTV
jgi:hypothetical protein